MDEAVLDAAAPEVPEPDALGFNLAGPSADTARMGTQKLTPIRSTCDEDPALAEAVDAFVIGLGEWIDHLQDAHAEGDLTAVSEAARNHAAEAVRVGYPQLAETAGQVASSADAGDAEAARKSIGDLIELVQRIRLGHRSAA